MKRRKDVDVTILVFLFFGMPRNCASDVGRLSGHPENVPVMSGDFRERSKTCQRCRETFGNARKRADDVGRLSGTPESNFCRIESRWRTPKENNQTKNAEEVILLCIFVGFMIPCSDILPS